MMREFLDEFTEELILSSIKPKIQLIQPELGFPYLQQPVSFQPALLPRSIPKLQIEQSKPIQPMGAPQITRAVPLQLPPGADKIAFLLRNPRTTAVECPGPGKFLILRKGLRTEITKISLTEQEIKNKIQEFSERTRIPLIGGLFKATIDNLTISAVISDYAGSRFIINKFIPISNIPAPPNLPGYPSPRNLLR